MSGSGVPRGQNLGFMIHPVTTMRRIDARLAGPVGPTYAASMKRILAVTIVGLWVMFAGLAGGLSLFIAVLVGGQSIALARLGLEAGVAVMVIGILAMVAAGLRQAAVVGRAVTAIQRIDPTVTTPMCQRMLAVPAALAKWGARHPGGLPLYRD